MKKFAALVLVTVGFFGLFSHEQERMRACHVERGFAIGLGEICPISR